MHTVSLVANNYHYMKIYNQDTTFFAAHYGSIVSTNNLCNAFLNPIVGSLSDRFGRRWILAGTRVGWLLWWFLLPRIRTPFQRRMGEVLCWGILGAGTWTVFGAAYSDRFGDRPELTAQVITPIHVGAEGLNREDPPRGLVGCFLALGSGLRLVRTASSRR